MPRNYHDIASRLAPHILHDAREWMQSVFAPKSVRRWDASRVLHWTDANWDGGLHAFIQSSILRDQDPFLRPTITLEIAP